MVGSVNKVILVGNLGRDPEIRSTQDGREVCNFPIATSENWRDKNTNERRERTEWHRVVIFTPGLVNIAKSYLRKGAKVYIEGALQTRKWQDTSGVDKYTTEVVLQGFSSSLMMLDSKGSSDGYDSNYNNDDYSDDYSSNNNNNNSSQKQEAFAGADDLDDEIPF